MLSPRRACCSRASATATHAYSSSPRSCEAVRDVKSAAAPHPHPPASGTVVPVPLAATTWASSTRRRERAQLPLECPGGARGRLHAPAWLRGGAGRGLARDRRRVGGTGTLAPHSAGASTRRCRRARPAPTRRASRLTAAPRLPRVPSGGQVHVMLKACERAAAAGISCEAIDLATIMPWDMETVLNSEPPRPNPPAAVCAR